jgi:N6-L-threonylcarbamoyladenine synthase
MTVAKTLSYLLKKPLIWVHHIEAHIFANLLERDITQIPFPSVVLTVSGGHTEIYNWKSLFEFECIGATRDDAAGEAFDKVSKMMGL